MQEMRNQMKKQDEVMKLMREDLCEAGLRLLKAENELSDAKAEKSKQYKRHDSVYFGEDLCQDAYDRKDATRFKVWRLNVANYLSTEDDDMAGDILEWLARRKRRSRRRSTSGSRRRRTAMKKRSK